MAIDDDGNTSTVREETYAFQIDSAAPTITVTSPTSGATISGPSSGVPVIVNGSTFDDVSGVKSILVRVDSGAYKAVTPVAPGDFSSWTVTHTIATEGSHNLVVRAEDNLGKVRFLNIPINIVFTA
jgi:hypothetical protein